MQHFRPYRNLFVSIVMLVVAFSCSKFEDGPKMSFRTVENRIYGKYRIVLFSKNDTDLTSYWNQHYNLTFDFHYDPTGSYPDIHGASIKGYIDSLGYMKYYNVSYYLGISNEDNVVKMTMSTYIIDTTAYPNRLLYPIIIYSHDYWPLFTVTRLTNDEMWLRHTNGNDVYEIHLKE